MNKVKVYTEEEIKKLSTNPNVRDVKNKHHIHYKNEFKLWAVKEKINHPEKTSRQIFVEGGFDMSIIDDRTPQRRLCSWIKKYKMFGEDYFNDKNKYTYQAKTFNTEKERVVWLYDYIKKLESNPKCLGFTIGKDDNGELNLWYYMRK